MTTIADSIQLLKTLIFDENCKQLNKGSIKGYLGELIVLEKLKLEGKDVIHKGNQSGADLIYNSKTIDVKTSTFKMEYKSMKNLPYYWGYLLQSSTKKKKISEIFVCVALDTNLNVDSYYLIHSNDILLFPQAPKRFKNVIHGYAISIEKFPLDSHTFFSKSQELTDKGVVKKVRPKESLSKKIDAFYP